jgi:hypothetical protein
MGAGETRQAIEAVGLMPGDAEVFGLLALMEIQASRLPARSGPDGALIPPGDTLGADAILATRLSGEQGPVQLAAGWARNIASILQSGQVCGWISLWPALRSISFR